MIPRKPLDSDKPKDDDLEIDDKVNPFHLCADLTNNDVSVLIAYLTGVLRTDQLVKLYGLFGKEVILFLATFEGDALKIPRMKYLIKSKHYCKIYSFIMSRGYCDEVLQEAADLFGVRVSHIKAVYNKVKREMCKIIDGKVTFPESKEIDKVLEEEKNAELEDDE